MAITSLFSSFNNVLDPLFSPLLSMGAFWAVVIISLVLSVLMTLIYKWTTDQSTMKDLKSRIKGFQTEMKNHRDNPEKAMSLQKEAMQVNLEYMKHSLRPTLFTFIPVILIFGWLSSHLAFEPLIPGEQIIDVTTIPGMNHEVILIEQEGITLIDSTYNENIHSFTISAEAGRYPITFSVGENLYTKEILVTEDQAYLPPTEEIEDGVVKSITVHQTPLKFSFGFIKLGWLWTYILVSVISSLLLRKAMKLH